MSRSDWVRFPAIKRQGLPDRWFSEPHLGMIDKARLVDKFVPQLAGMFVVCISGLKRK